MPDDKGPQITAVSWSFGSVAIIVVAIRLYTRLILTRKAGWDDFFIVLSLVGQPCEILPQKIAANSGAAWMQLSAVVCSGLAQTGVHYGLGKHMADISNGEWKIEAFKYTVIAPNFSMVSTTTGKLSVAVFLLRLMGQTASPAKRWFLYIFSVISIAWNVLAIVAIMGYCRPAEKIWRPEVPGSCFSLKFQLIAGISQASFNAFADLTLALFPVIIFWSVQLPWKMKLGVIAVMGAGILAAAATLVKAILLKSLPVHSDITWSWADITTWYSIEMYVIIICATLPTLRQSYNFALHRTRYAGSYYKRSHSEAAAAARHKPIPLAPSHEDTLISPARGSNHTIITKTTEIEVHEENKSRRDIENPHFPRANPFRRGHQ
ncbi:uncharacterized protein BO88DRAFT_176241 [Aspergillus vadensis CBS 113365]|uniref:Rhodopsin domain-containing protein n=1 Tax=Aspergillus vadensis (strain CBS 113365 / IMI 142717 / IBT 24658) TaxID=1448311 RepID=A0A319BL18_ASPVC|nr:hypothetical protein BO88DRAFT_176241 [Aspergillus vadensis CBS 113365]PYH73051.1 hypothetical protein BO88DRAFT_176241 [Aspergillus vadensis CBS 113365]